MGDSVIGLKC